MESQDDGETTRSDVDKHHTHCQRISPSVCALRGITAVHYIDLLRTGHFDGEVERPTVLEKASLTIVTYCTSLLPDCPRYPFIYLSLSQKPDSTVRSAHA